MKVYNIMKNSSPMYDLFMKNIGFTGYVGEYGSYFNGIDCGTEKQFRSGSVYVFFDCWNFKDN